MKLKSSLYLPVAICVFGLLPAAAMAQLQSLGEVTTTGVIKSIGSNEIVIVDDEKKEYTFRIQDKDEEVVELGEGKFRLRFPATVKLSGELNLEKLKPGSLIRFAGQVNRLGATSGTVESIELVEGSADAVAGIEVVKAGDTPADAAECTITGNFKSIRNDRMLMNVPVSELTRKTSLAFKLAEEVKVSFASDDYHRANPGDRVTKLVGEKINTGDTLIRILEIEASGADLPSTSAEDSLAAKFSQLSDEPSAPRDVRSRNFLLHTDVSDREAQIILAKLETMIGLVSGYFGTAPGGLIECFVVRDLSQWPSGALDPGGARKIANGEGVTMSSSLGRQRRSIVYSCDKHEVVQHEAIHAYCFLTFGSTGPTWYSEGVAELGAYWKADKLEVDISPGVIGYLKNAPPKELLAIVAAGQITGDSWQAYAWRWALCNLLVNNPNYSGRFKALGLGMMTETPGASFEAVYGPVAKEISFEYEQFVEHLDNGYRADLCAWDWRTKVTPIKADKRVKTEVLAARGWQATGVAIEAGVSYDAIAVGKWKLQTKGAEITAGGDSKGDGKLIAAIFNNYKLSKPFELGEKHRFTAPTGGALVVRCREDFHKIADNDGAIELWIRNTPTE